MENNFIKLPCLEKIWIKNYPLFNKDWDYDIKTGVNLFIGANGLGKTTSTNLIIYGIIGYFQDINVEYFRDRLHVNEDDDDIIATVAIRFCIGEHSLYIRRHILSDNIESLIIDDEDYSLMGVDNLDEVYESYLTQFTGLKELDDIAFIFQKFLIRVEEGNYLLWDHKGSDQSRLIRLLINQAGFDDEYNQAARKTTDIDSELRKLQDQRAQFVKRLIEAQKSQKEELQKQSSFLKINDIQKIINQLSETIKYKKEEFESLHKNLHELNQSQRKLNNDFETKSLEIEQNSETLIALENQLFANVYSDDKVLMAIHKLKHYNQCIFCGQHPKKEIREEIVNSVEYLCECPVCNSEMQQDKTVPTENKLVIGELEKINLDLEEAKVKLEITSEKRKICSAEIENLFRREKELRKEIQDKSAELNDLKIQSISIEKNPEMQVTAFDKQVKALEIEIDRYDDLIRPKRQEYQIVLSELEAKNKDQLSVINLFLDKLNSIFERYTNKFFPSQCKLAVVPRKPTDSKVVISSYVPEFEGSVRNSISKCSTSQRIFLEYLFRLSLLELYNEESGYSAFMVLETSEGAFDLSVTKQVAKSFSDFSSSNIPLILISNFSKEDFLIEIGKAIEHDENRILNFIDFGRLSKIQHENLKQFEDIVNRIKAQ